MLASESGRDGKEPGQISEDGIPGQETKGGDSSIDIDGEALASAEELFPAASPVELVLEDSIDEDVVAEAGPEPVELPVMALWLTSACTREDW